MQSGSHIETTHEKEEKVAIKEIKPIPESSASISKELKIDFTKLTRPGYIYKIILPKLSRPFRILTLGCADGAANITDQVAELADQVAGGEAYDLILVLGDNLNKKVYSPSDKVFLTHFHNIFAKYPKLKNIPKIVIFGNHDVMDGYGYQQKMQDAQAFHTFLKLTQHSETGNIEYVIDPETNQAAYDPEKIALFMPKAEDTDEITIRYEDLQKSINQWILTSTHCAFDFGNEFEIICSNSSTLAVDSLSQISGKIDPFNQATWLSKIANRPSAPITKFLASHHPILITIDKRTCEGASDHPDYINDDQYESLAAKGIAELGENKEQNSNHTDVLRNLVFHPGDEKLGIPKGWGDKITAFICAHHHAKCFFHDGKHVQIISGGAGGPPPLQPRWSFKQHQHIHGFVKDNGVVILTIPQGPHPEILFDFHSLHSPHLCFSIDRGKSIQQPQTESVKKMQTMVIEACALYQDYLAKNPLRVGLFSQIPTQIKMFSFVPKLGHYLKKYAGKINDEVPDDVNAVDELRNYFNAFEIINAEQAFSYLQNLLIKLSNYHKWREIFHQTLMEHYKLGYDDFIQSAIELDKKIDETSSKATEKETEKKAAEDLVITPTDISPPMTTSLLSKQIGQKQVILKSPPNPLTPGLFTSVRAVVVGTPKRPIFPVYQPRHSSPVSIPGSEAREHKKKNKQSPHLSGSRKYISASPALVTDTGTLTPQGTDLDSATQQITPKSLPPLERATSLDNEPDSPRLEDLMGIPMTPQ